MEGEALALQSTVQNKAAELAQQSSSSTKTVAQNQQKTNQTTTQEPVQRSSSQPAKTTQTPRVSYAPVSKNAPDGYYVVFGSFIERNNAERFLGRLQTRFPNVVDIGNDNIFGMYRTGIGPYKTKEEAIAQRPHDMKNWVLRIETINTRIVAYFELFDFEYEDED